MPASKTGCQYRLLLRAGRILLTRAPALESVAMLVLVSTNFSTTYLRHNSPDYIPYEALGQSGRGASRIVSERQIDIQTEVQTGIQGGAQTAAHARANRSA